MADLEDMRIGALEACLHCNYWTWHYIQGTFIDRSSLGAFFYTLLLGKIREFEDVLPEPCSIEIATWLRRKPNYWYSVSPSRFEKLVADVFRANYSLSEVCHVGSPDDGGVDVIYVDADKKQWLIQVKRRERAKATESVTTIRNLLGTMLLEDSSYGIVVSTADHFSYRAYHAVNRASERGMTIRLLDRKAFDHMLDGLLVDRPWLGTISSTFPDLAKRILRMTVSKPGKSLYQQLQLL